VVVEQLAGADEHAHAEALEGGADVVGLLERELQQPLVDLVQVRVHGAVGGEVHPEAARVGEARHGVRGGDEGLGRHHVGEHRGPAEALALHDGDLRTERRRDHRRFVAAGSATEDREAQ
jgi:hypothetical protein